MTRIPHDGSLDSSLALLADPYRFIGRRAQQLRTDVFATRLLGRPTICMRGHDAAALFYDTARMRREGAMPRRVVRTLLGDGGVQGLDEAAHRRRKALFLDLATDDAVDRLLAIAVRHSRSWSRCSTVPARSARGTGRRRWRAGAPNAGSLPRSSGSGPVRRAAAPPLARIARHLDADGRPLSPHVAAVELLNLIRPITAVSVYVTFIAHALHRQPRQRAWIASGDARALHGFVQEVRRFYPFFPAVAAPGQPDVGRP